MAQRRKKPSSTRKRKTPARRSTRKKITDITFSQMLLIAFIFSLPFCLFGVRHSVCSTIFDLFACASIQQDNGGSIIYEAMDYNNQIYKNEIYEEKLKSLLADEVVWFDNKGRAKNKERIDFTGSPYSKFCFCEQPINHSSPEEIRRGDYELNFIGLYQYKNPDGKLFKSEGGVAIVESGLIKSITTYKEDVPHKNAINDFYKYYWGIIYIFVFAFVFLLLKVFKGVEDILLNIINRIIKIFIGV